MPFVLENWVSFAPCSTFTFYHGPLLLQCHILIVSMRCFSLLIYFPPKHDGYYLSTNPHTSFRKGTHYFYVTSDAGFM